jgi:tRNA threonylcarbamoyladenosine biosynthesis protein TsaB
MSLILNIDTSFDTASVCLAKGSNVLQLSFSANQKDHASWLHIAVVEMLQKNKYSIIDLEAVAVSVGPGSHTGLRIGLAAAKGFCYALHIPLITINTPEVIALAVKDEAAGCDFICPIIDARRMEVFTAVYDKSLHEKISVYTMIITKDSFSSLISSGKILFCGNGAKKLQNLISNDNAIFSNTIANASHLAQLSLNRFHIKEFADLAYAEPLYVKEFYSEIRKD